MIYDVIVVGSGPGGAVAAATLASRGKSVLMVDRQSFPRDKVCGDGLPAEVMSFLRQMDVDVDAAKLQYQRIHSLAITSPSGRILKTHEKKRDVFSMTSPRLSFDHMLHNHALRTGAKFEMMNIHKPLMSADGRKVVGVVERQDNRMVEHEARVVIAAGGVGSPISRALRGDQSQADVTAIAIRAYICLKQPVEPCVHFFFQPELLPGYAWIFPVGKNRANIGVYLHNDTYKSQKRSLRDLLNDFQGWLGREFEFEIDPATIKTWSLPLYVSDESRAMPGVLFVGDEGRFINALTGGGIYSAMVTGQVAGLQAINLLEGQSVPPANYDRLWQQRVGSELRRGRFVQQHIAGNPLIFNGLFAVSTHPRLKKPLLKMIAGDHY
jgi:geranylgeranyl reductase family protein